MATKKERHFNVSDADMLSSAHHFVSSYQANQPQFVQLDSQTFKETFLQNFSNAITEAEKMSSDDVLIDRQVQETEDVAMVMAECLEEVRFARYFVTKAFKPRSAIINQFGYNDLQDARNSVNKMVLFMEDFSQNIHEHQETLQSFGYLPDRATMIQELLARLKQERSEQQAAKDYREVATEQRIGLMNSVWNYMIQLNDASKYCLCDNELAQELFLLPVQEAPIKSDPGVFVH